MRKRRNIVKFRKNFIDSNGKSELFCNFAQLFGETAGCRSVAC